MATLKVAVVTPERAMMRGEVDMVVAPSAMGQVGIMPQHQPLLADLEAGSVILKKGDKVDVYAISGGFLEVDREQVTILAETAERSADIDADRAKKALADAEAKLKTLDVASPEYVEESARAKRAAVRLHVGTGGQ